MSLPWIKYHIHRVPPRKLFLGYWKRSSKPEHEITLHTTATTTYILKLPASKTSILLPYCHIAVRQLSHPWQLQINLEIAVRKKRFWFWKASLTTNSVLNSCGFFRSSFLIKKNKKISNWKGAQSTSWLEETSRVNTEVPFRSPQSDWNTAPVGSRNWNTLHRVALLPIHSWHQRCPVRLCGMRIIRKHPVAVVKGPKINKSCTSRLSNVIFWGLVEGDCIQNRAGELQSPSPFTTMFDHHHPHHYRHHNHQNPHDHKSSSLSLLT